MKAVVLLVCIFTGIIYGQPKYIPNAESPYSTWEAESLFVNTDLEIINPDKPVRVRISNCSNSSFGRIFWRTNDTSKSLELLFTKDSNCTNTTEITGLQDNSILRFVFFVDSAQGGSVFIKNKKLYSGTKNSTLFPENDGFKNGLVATGKVGEDVTEIGFDNGIGAFSELHLVITNVKIVK